MRRLMPLLCLLASVPALAADPVIDPYATAARAADPAFAGFSAARGERLYRATGQPGVIDGCTRCHTADPRQPGRHAKTAKVIGPLAPVADAQRFTDPANVEKWFRRNCKEVLARECTPVEKGDFVTWIRSVR